MALVTAAYRRSAGIGRDIVDDGDPSESIRRRFADLGSREVYFGAGFICGGTAP